MNGDGMNGDGHREPEPPQVGGDSSSISPEHLPPRAGHEFDALVRELDRVGSVQRARLSRAAEERIFAASDLQLPLAGSALHVAGGGSLSSEFTSAKFTSAASSNHSGNPVIGRIVSGRVSASRTRSLPWLRIAAAVAVVGGLSALAVVLARSAPIDQPMLPSETLVQAPTGADINRDMRAGTSETVASAVVSGSGSSSRPLPPVPTSEHFERALVELNPPRATVIPERAIVVALAEPRRLAYEGASRQSRTSRASGFISESASARTPATEDLRAVGSLAPMSDGLDDDLDLDFDALSGEFAAIVSQSAALR